MLEDWSRDAFCVLCCVIKDETFGMHSSHLKGPLRKDLMTMNGSWIEVNGVTVIAHGWKETVNGSIAHHPILREFWKAHVVSSGFIKEVVSVCH